MPTEEGTATNSLNINIRDLAAEAEIPFAEEAAESGGASAIFARIVSRFLSIAIVIGAILLLFNLVYGGLEWIMAGGDSGKIEKARGRITQSVVGMLVLSASVAIFMLVNYLLGSPVSVNSVNGNWGGGGGNPQPGRCACWNGKHASVGAVGRLVNKATSPCYICTSSGQWVLTEGTCGVITCY